MDKLLSVHSKRANKQPKSKKIVNKQQPVKVVYISNPMRVEASASDFRALVQELTGQDADSSPDPSRFPCTGNAVGGRGGGGGPKSDTKEARKMDPSVGESSSSSSTTTATSTTSKLSDHSFERSCRSVGDGSFATELMEDFPGLWSSSGDIWCSDMSTYDRVDVFKDL